MDSSGTGSRMWKPNGSGGSFCKRLHDVTQRRHVVDIPVSLAAGCAGNGREPRMLSGAPM